ncbi:hypothetical protein MN608_02822 [Microdochium nivale]|nr:hypothetical protein MN608_02822 [Microdochium nivale]
MLSSVAGFFHKLCNWSCHTIIWLPIRAVKGPRTELYYETQDTCTEQATSVTAQFYHGPLHFSSLWWEVLYDLGSVNRRAFRWIFHQPPWPGLAGASLVIDSNEARHAHPTPSHTNGSSAAASRLS